MYRLLQLSARQKLEIATAISRDIVYQNMKAVDEKTADSHTLQE